MLAERIQAELTQMTQCIIISLAQISGARFENTLSDLEWCAENKEDEMAIKALQYLAEALLSAYEIQRKTY